MICGERIFLRAINKEDLPQLMEWRNNPEFRKYFREYRELNLEMQEQWFSALISDNKTIMFSIISNDEKKELLGCCGLCYLNWIQRNADLSLYIGWQNSYIDNCGYAEEACILLFKYAFGELYLNKIWTEIYEFDQLKNNLYLSLGFKQDGLLRQNYYYDNRWWDSRIMSLLSAEFK
jgi:RimJ/RimL family protein N-acetyltransferase